MIYFCSLSYIFIHSLENIFISFFVCARWNISICKNFIFLYITALRSLLYYFYLVSYCEYILFYTSYFKLYLHYWYLGVYKTKNSFKVGILEGNYFSCSVSLYYMIHPYDYEKFSQLISQRKNHNEWKYLFKKIQSNEFIKMHCKIIFLFQVFDKVTSFSSDNAICLQNEVLVMILSSKWGYSDDVIYLHTGL